VLRSFRKRAAEGEALRRVKAWTRERFALAPDTAIMVSELACGLPGCPPVETVVAFWTAADRRHQFKVFKPLADVAEDDLPPSWMRDRLVADETFGCECC
jgi:nitrate reductase delta subunit